MILSDERGVVETDVLITAGEIAAAVADLGRELSELYRGQTLVVIPLLKGGFMFASDLVRCLDLQLQIEFLGAASYGDATTTSGEVQLTQDTTLPLAGRHVLLVEDIVDSGLTLAYIQKLITSRKPASLRTVVLLDKRVARRHAVAMIYRALFEIPDRFVFGYGLDSPGGFHRNLPDVVAVRDTCTEGEEGDQ